MEIVTLVISVLAILASGFTYITHDRKLKKQEKQMNAYQLKRNQEEEHEQKKARIRASVVKEYKGEIKLKVYNTGKAIARNVNMEIQEENVISNMDNLFPYEFMHPQDHTDGYLFLHSGSPDKINIILTWGDDHQKDNRHHQILTL